MLYISIYRICWLCVFLFIESVHVMCWLCIFLFLESVHVKDDLLHIIGERNQYHHYIMWAEDSCYNRVTGTVTVTTFNGVGPSLNFLHLLKFSIYSKKFFHNFLLSESSFTCPGVIWYFEPHGKLNPGSIYLWYFDPGFNFPYGILTPGSIFCHCILNPFMVNWPPPPLISTKREEFIIP